MEYLFGGHCDQGDVRQTNQDSLFLASDTFAGQDLILGVICDGVGSFAESGYASAAVTLRLREWFSSDIHRQTLLSDDLLEDLSGGLMSALVGVNRQVVNWSQENGTPTATTASVLLICGSRYFLVHVGDSRIYRVNHDIFMLTKDHTARRVTGQTALTRCIGMRQETEFFTAFGTVFEGDAFLLCTDGFYHTLDRDKMVKEAKRIRNKTDLNALAASFVEEARKNGEQDNISLGIIKRL